MKTTLIAMATFFIGFLCGASAMNKWGGFQ